jgi:alginate O-acetyltransferase complex protein AlgJ
MTNSLCFRAAICAAFVSTPLWAAPPKPAAPKAALVVTGRVKAATKPPRPRSVPYKDAVISLHLTGVKVVSGKLSNKDIVVFLWGMKNNKWTPAASYRAGQTVKLNLVPWERVERKYDSYNRFEVEGDAVSDLDIYWAQ